MCACSNGQADIESETNMSEADFKAQASVTALQTMPSASFDAASNTSSDTLLVTDAEAHPTDQGDGPTTALASPGGNGSPNATRQKVSDRRCPILRASRPGFENLVVAVGQVEELSRRARDAAATDLALYSDIAASQRQFEEGLSEAQRIGHEAEDVYARAFGREAKAVAEPAVLEAREVEREFAQLADAWRSQAESFLSGHPDVESLLAEQRQQEEEMRRRDIARSKAERFQQLVNGTPMPRCARVCWMTRATV